MLYLSYKTIGYTVQITDNTWQDVVTILNIFIQLNITDQNMDQIKYQ